MIEFFASWQFFALLAVFVWAFVNIVDKHFLQSKVDSVGVATAFTCVSSVLTLLFVLVVWGQSVSAQNLSAVFLGLLAGILSIGTLVFYYKALQSEEVSRVIPVFQFGPIFTAVMAAAFLGEVFKPEVYAGVLLVVAGSVLVFQKKIVLGKTFFHGISLGKGFWFALAAILLFSIASIVLKYASAQTGIVNLFFWTRVGWLTASLPFLVLRQKVFSETVAKHPKFSVFYTGANLLSSLAGLSLTAAISLGFVTLVAAVSAVQPLFVLLFAMLLSVFKPEILREEIGRRALELKLAGIILTIVGAIIVAQ